METFDSSGNTPMVVGISNLHLRIQHLHCHNEGSRRFRHEWFYTRYSGSEMFELSRLRSESTRIRDVLHSIETKPYLARVKQSRDRELSIMRQVTR